MEMSAADLGAFIHRFLHSLADRLDREKVESITPQYMRDHADLIILHELDKELDEPDGT